jgi:polysaccharide deacetylase 2 family uncharacterized protein YibQ
VIARHGLKFGNSSWRACLTGLLLAAAMTLWSAAAVAAERTAPDTDAIRPSIALIIDDLGNQHAAGQRAIELPGPVACAFLPYGHFTRQLAQQAHTRGKEVMLHLPMQSVNHDASDRGELVLDMTQQQFTRTLTAGLAAVPHVSGINNHRGSLITRHPGHMTWLMQALRQRGGLFFVDSRTTAATVARQIAEEYRVPSIERNVFLDNDRQPDAVQAEFRRLIRIAQRDGTALGIAHPYPETLQVLARELSSLEDYNVQVVSVNRLIEIETESKQQWQLSSYH